MCMAKKKNVTFVTNHYWKLGKNFKGDNMRTTVPKSAKFTRSEWNLEQWGKAYRSAKRCPTCRRRIRGKGHEDGAHHKRAGK